MNILVCLKQVPDSTVRVKVAPGGGGIVTDGMTWAIAPYDEYAVELALEAKDADPPTTVSAVSVGPARAKDALRQSLAMGVDNASLIVGETQGLAVASALAAFVAEAKPDVVLCGKQASDDDQGLVGPALAEALGWPHVAIVTKFTGAPGNVEIWKETEGGHEIWKASGPVVITVQKSEKEPRYPSLPGIMKAKKKEIPERELASLGAASTAPAIQITSMEPPPDRGGGKILKDGDSGALATQLARMLRDEAKVL